MRIGDPALTQPLVPPGVAGAPGVAALEASVDARLAWAMSDAAAVRAPAAAIAAEAARLVRQAAAARDSTASLSP